jgi:hypothetical protein
MQDLKFGWLCNDLNDEEGPKYKFLNYINQVYKALDQNKLFPVWEDAYQHYRQLKTLQNRFTTFDNFIPKEVLDIDPIEPKINYKTLPFKGDSDIEIIKSRINFAKPILRKACKYSEKLRTELDARIDFGPLGVYVQNKEEGLLLTKNKDEDTVWSWYYKKSISKNEYPYSTLNTRLIGKFQYHLAGGFTKIKYESLKACNIQGNVLSTWLLISNEILPSIATLKPLGIFHIAKELEL